MGLREYLDAGDRAEARVADLAAELALLAVDSPHAALIAALQAFRGIGQTTAIALVAELGDLRRFPSPRDLMGYTGLVATEHSSAEHHHRGGITKTGNAHIRHLLIEAAWHYRRPPAMWPVLRRRQNGVRPAVIAIGWKAQQRLHRRFTHRGKLPQVAVVAVARELAGFLWAAAQHIPAVTQTRSA